MEPYFVKNNVEDVQLWQEFKSGNEKAFSRIFKANYTFLYNYGLKLSNNNPDLTKDAIQELFITIWNNRSNLGNAPSIRFYLLKSLRRKIIRTLKAQKSRFNSNIPDDYEFEIVFSQENIIINEQMKEEQREYFLRLLNCLSKRQKEAIYLKFYQNLNYQEIGEIMELNYQSIRNYVHQAIAVFRKQIKEPVNIVYLLMSLNF